MTWAAKVSKPLAQNTPSVISVNDWEVPDVSPGGAVVGSSETDDSPNAMDKINKTAQYFCFDMPDSKKGKTQVLDLDSNNITATILRCIGRRNIRCCWKWGGISMTPSAAKCGFQNEWLNSNFKTIWVWASERKFFVIISASNLFKTAVNKGWKRCESLKTW